MPFGAFAEAHAQTLEAIFLRDPGWREVEREGLLEAARRDLTTPRRTTNVFDLPAAQLKAINEQRVLQLIAAGERDEDRLLAVLGAWPAQWPHSVPVRLAFLGLNLSFRCNMRPRCTYCNQAPVEDHLGPDDWRALVCSLAAPDGEGTYISITGGEPLLFGEELWGQEGLIKAAAQAGAACNINTNGLDLSPEASIGLIRAGLGRVHISLDTHLADVQDAICGCKGRWSQVVRGLWNLQIAKTLLGAEHPIIHINCVLTRHNAAKFPGFLRFLLDMKPIIESSVSPDLDLHLIPVGGEQNQPMRLTAVGYQEFFGKTWEAAEAVWHAYQSERGLPADKRGPLHEQVPFLSPFHRVQQRGDLAEWAERAAAGFPAALALTQRCYVAPTQAFVLPDGTQYWCGGHTVSRPDPVGNVLTDNVQDNIRRSLRQVHSFPAAHCRDCAGATQAINQAVEAKLRQTIAEWLSPRGSSAATSQADQRAFE